MNTDGEHNGPARDTSPNDSKSRHRFMPRSSPSFMSSGPCSKPRPDEHAVVWNGQRCFDWVAPADVLRSLLHSNQAETPSPAITIIEYHSGSHYAESLNNSLEGLGERLDAVSARIEQVLVPLVEQNRALRNNDTEKHFVRPLLETVIQTLDRLEDELNDAGDSRPLNALRDARRADREELRQLLARYGVTPRYPRRGDLFQRKWHQVTSNRSTESTAKVGRVRRTLRPAYIRDRDGEAIRRARVEVYVPANAVAHT